MDPEKEPSVVHQEERTASAGRDMTTRGDREEVADGTINLYDSTGTIQLIPVPSSDPNDPLRIPERRKWAVLFTICLFAAAGLTAVQSIAAILPTVSLYYQDLDPNMMSMGSAGMPPGGLPPNGLPPGGLPPGVLPSDGLPPSGLPPGGIPPSGALIRRETHYEGISFPSVPGKPSQQTISQLGTLPSLFVGLGGILSILGAQLTGTRLMMVLDAAIVVVCLCWAAASNGKDHGLYSHIGARCVLGLGVGAVESLAPLIIQDINYVHNRNSKLAVLWSTGGIVGTGLGIASTYIVSALSWRWYYWILAFIGATALVLIGLVIPETSWARTEADLAGLSPKGTDGFVEPVRPSGRDRSYLYSLRLTSSETGAQKMWETCTDLLRCALFPNIIWLVCLNACFIGVVLSSGLVLGNVLVINYGWSPDKIGLSTIPLAVSSLVAIPVIGFGGDRVIQFLAKRNNGVHEPEHQLPNLILPVICGAVGTLIFGISCSHADRFHWAVPLVMTGVQQFGFIAANVISTTYGIECFPDLAGPIVIAVGAYRNIVGFGISYGVVDFVTRAGFDGCFGTYAGIMSLLGLLGIPFYIKGKALRQSMSTWRFRRSRGARFESGHGQTRR